MKEMWGVDGMFLAIVILFMVTVSYLVLELSGFGIKKIKDWYMGRVKIRKYKKDLGKSYIKILKELEKYLENKIYYERYNKTQYAVNLRLIERVIKLYKETPEEYSLLMHKYYPTISLTLHMLEEAEKAGLEKNINFNDKLWEMIREYGVDFYEREKYLKKKDKQGEKMELEVLGKQMMEEIRIIKEVKKMRGK